MSKAQRLDGAVDLTNWDLGDLQAELPKYIKDLCFKAASEIVDAASQEAWADFMFQNDEVGAITVRLPFTIDGDGPGWNFLLSDVVDDALEIVEKKENVIALRDEFVRLTAILDAWISK